MKIVFISHNGEQSHPPLIPTCCCYKILFNVQTCLNVIHPDFFFFFLCFNISKIVAIMEFEHTEMLRKNHCALLKMNYTTLCPKLIKCGLFKSDEIDHCMASTKTALDGHRKIIWAVYDKGPKAFDMFVKCVRQSGHQELANKLLGVELPITYNHTISAPVNTSEPVNTELDYVNIDVRIVENFMDDFSAILKPYTMRSKNRGAVLIINNITFMHKGERRGAGLDQENLLKLFTQMGGYYIKELTDVGHYELKKGIEDFKQNEILKLVDVAFVFIMSHGDEINNEANVECSDGLHVPASWIESQFYRDGCPYMQNKPKIIVYQTCRGNEHDGPPVMHFDVHKWTETDGTSNVPVRKHSDILVCHSTVRGYKAHRHTGKGSWYIQSICKVFMQYACQYHVVDLFQLVDKEMSTLQSEVNGSMQTTGFHNSGFRHCYLNPGIYESHGKLCRFNR